MHFLSLAQYLDIWCASIQILCTSIKCTHCSHIKDETKLFTSLLHFHIHSQNKLLQTDFCSFSFKILLSKFFFFLFKLYMSHCSLNEMIYNKNLTGLVFLEHFLLWNKHSEIWRIAVVKCVSEKEGCSFIEPPNTHCLHSLFHEQDADITQFTRISKHRSNHNKVCNFYFCLQNLLLAHSLVPGGKIQLVFQKPKSKDFRK